MNNHILNSDIQEFITENLNSKITSILLKGTQFSLVSTSEIIEQIESKKRSIKKLPMWYNTKNIYYPNKLNIEQTSSEITAKYKSELIHGSSIIDTTGGFGVDCYFFSKRFKSVTHCEINTSLSKIAKHNYKQLNTSNITTVNYDGLDYLKTNPNEFDWIYIDPSRRHDSKGKVFFLKDCLPNVPDNLGLLFSRTKNVLIKTSPLLDISLGIKELENVKTIHIVAVNNEVKELLWILEKGFIGEPSVKTVNIKNNRTEKFDFKLLNEKETTANYSQPLTYLYEPNAAILKAGAFNLISQQLKVLKLHQHSHLYTSEIEVTFPGRTFNIEQVISYNKKALKKVGIQKANITTRNFPETVQQLRKKFKISDGGDIYLFFTTNSESKKIIIVARK